MVLAHVEPRKVYAGGLHHQAFEELETIVDAFGIWNQVNDELIRQDIYLSPESLNSFIAEFPELIPGISNRKLPKD